MSPVGYWIADADSEAAIAYHYDGLGAETPFAKLTKVPGNGLPLSLSALSEDFADIASGRYGRTGGLGERLLSVAIGKLWTAYPDPQAALFLAVTACEVKVKTKLGLDPGRGGPLMRYFSERCQRVFGRSLEYDDPDLWARLNRLRKARNEVAHGGEEPAYEACEQHLSTAMEVFAWLDSF